MRRRRWRCSGGGGARSAAPTARPPTHSNPSCRVAIELPFTDSRSTHAAQLGNACSKGAGRPPPGAGGHDPSPRSSSHEGVEEAAGDGAPPPPGTLEPPPPLPPPPTGGPRGEWQLLWQDVFDRACPFEAPSCWQAQLGDGRHPYGIPGWGNQELQWYTDRPDNVRIEGGRLVIQARFDGDAPAGQRYTSARIRTAGRFGVAPSAAHPCIRIEARIAVTPGAGLWPAFWLLPEHPSAGTCSGGGHYGGWAASGELDVCELANGMDKVIGSIHYGGAWPANRLSSAHTALPAGTEGEFHNYAVEWSSDQISWFLDGSPQPVFAARSRGSSASGQGAADGGWHSAGPGAGPCSPFDRPFHLILNLALGGPQTSFTAVEGVGIREQQLQATLRRPCHMQVEWVRVWGLTAAQT